MIKKELNVHIGEIKIAKNGETLKTILGSCVGIGFLWKKKKMCGLAHCLLAESPRKTFDIGGRFVDQAVPSLIAMMKIRPDLTSEIEVIVAGGGNMTQAEAPSDGLVGSHNLAVAKRELEKHGFKISVFEPGVSEGRKITIDSEDCSFRIESIPRVGSAA
jgi:chemotaxis protein CheD